jgi:hypothetical protein
MARPGFFSARLHPLLFIFVVALVLGLPMLIYGPLVDGHDTYEHLNFTRHFSDQFWKGDLYPRWLIDMNHGLGSPSYFVFPPLPAYVFTLLQPAAKVFRFNAFNLAAFVPLLGSGICAFLWLNTMANQRVAAACAALFMVMPYHLWIDFYRRCAIPECWAFMWMPLILYFTIRMLRGERRALAGLAIASALMIFSHIVTLVMFFPLPVALVMTRSPAGQRGRSLARVCAGMLLGAGISSVYLLPALVNAKYIPASRLLSRDFYHVPNQVLSLGKGLFVRSPNGWVQFLQAISWTVVSSAVLIALCGFVALKFAPRCERKTIIGWIVICCFSVFIMSSVSSKLWNSLPRLLQAVQFPWRFNTLLCLGSVALLAISASSLREKSDAVKTIFLCGVALIAAIWLFPYGDILWRYKVDVPPGPPNERHLISDNDGWLVAWLVPGTNQRSALLASQGPKSRFHEGDGSAQIRLWKPRQIELETHSTTGGWVMINQFYYPTWRAGLVGKAPTFEIRAAMPEGLIEVNVPPGAHNIRVEIPMSVAEIAGRWLTLLCTLSCLVVLFRRKTVASRDVYPQPNLATATSL